MTNERLTDAQIIATVEAMNMADEHKAVLKRNALAGDSAARFTVYCAYRRPTPADRSAAVAAWAERTAK